MNIDRSQAARLIATLVQLAAGIDALTEEIEQLPVAEDQKALRKIAGPILAAISDLNRAICKNHPDLDLFDE